MSSSISCCTLNQTHQLIAILKVVFNMVYTMWSIRYEFIIKDIFNIRSDSFYRVSWYDLKKRGVRMRWITEITRENIPYCMEAIWFNKNELELSQGLIMYKIVWLWALLLSQAFRPIKFIYRLAKIRHKVKSLNMYIYNHPTNQKRRTIHHSESAQWVKACCVHGNDELPPH